MSERDSFSFDRPVSISPEGRERITEATQKTAEPELYGPAEAPIVGVESVPVYTKATNAFGGTTLLMTKGNNPFDSSRLATTYASTDPRAYNSYERQYLDDLAHRIVLSKLPRDRKRSIVGPSELDDLSPGQQRYVNNQVAKEEK